MLQAHAHANDSGRPWWRRPGRLSLRARLVLLVVVSVVPLIAFGLGNQYLQYRDAIDVTRRQTLEFARSLTAAVDQELQSRMVALQVLALSPALQGKDIDLAAFRAQAEAVSVQQFPGSNVVLLREDGQQLMNTLRAPVRLHHNFDRNVGSAQPRSTLQWAHGAGAGAARARGVPHAELYDASAPEIRLAAADVAGRDHGDHQVVHELG